MSIREFENKIISDITNVVYKIIESSLEVDIQANARAGAEISDYLENKFVEFSNRELFLKDTESAPRGATKNPWDAKTTYVYGNVQEVIWIDFKAIKVSSADSNPDIGTPNKVIKFINEGNFYLLYIYVFYDAVHNGIKFVKDPSNSDCYIKSYFLKDISSTFRRNPKNQLQVNVLESPSYRTREEFIELLFNKIKESHERQIQISENALRGIETEKELAMSNNACAEEALLEKLR